MLAASSSTGTVVVIRPVIRNDHCCARSWYWSCLTTRATQYRVSAKTSFKVAVIAWDFHEDSGHAARPDRAEHPAGRPQISGSPRSAAQGLRPAPAGRARAVLQETARVRRA